MLLLSPYGDSKSQFSFTEIDCSMPIVSNGIVTCTTSSGMMTDTPTHLDMCSVSCDVGFYRNRDFVTCQVDGNFESFDGVLQCQGSIVAILQLVIFIYEIFCGSFEKNMNS